MAHIRQSRPDYGLGLQVKVVKTVKVVPFSLGSGATSTLHDCPKVARRVVIFGVLSTLEFEIGVQCQKLYDNRLQIESLSKQTWNK